MTLEKSPKIKSVAWARMEVDGLDTGKDFKLYPGGGRAWDWGETGTRHQPGIQIGDVVELVEAGATTVVLSSGMDLKLHVCPSALQYLEGKKVTVHVTETREAVDIYNSLVDDRT